MDKKFANWAGGIIPRGWCHSQEQINFCKFDKMQLEGTFDPANKRISPSRIEANTQQLQREIKRGGLGRTLSCVLHHRVIAEAMSPSLSKIPLKAAMAQTAADQAAIACALERFRLAKGQFPDKLEALVPQFIFTTAQ